jgi:short-subunit dehydrogenase
MDYQNIKKIWLVGGSTGIGAALARKLADDGKEVVVSARSEDDLKKVASHSDKISYVVCDLTNRNSIASAIGHVGDYDCAIQCAGYYDTDHVGTFDAELFKKHYAINVEGTGNWLDPVLKYFRKKNKGRLVIIASVAGYHGLPKALSYGSTKAALINLTEAIACELHGSGISVQMVNPGFVKTRLTDKNDFEMPMMLTPDEAADAIVKGMKKGKFEISFPWKFTKPLRWFTNLPYCLTIPLIHKGAQKKM